MAIEITMLYLKENEFFSQTLLSPMLSLQNFSFYFSDVEKWLHSHHFKTHYYSFELSNTSVKMTKTITDRGAYQ